MTALLIPHRDAGSTFLKLGGRAYLVISIAMATLIVGLDERGSVGHAAIAVGADGVIVDVHPDPTAALCDGPQALYGELLEQLAAACRDLPPLVGRSLVTVSPRA